LAQSGRLLPASQGCGWRITFLLFGQQVQNESCIDACVAEITLQVHFGSLPAIAERAFKVAPLPAQSPHSLVNSAGLPQCLLRRVGAVQISLFEDIERVLEPLIGYQVFVFVGTQSLPLYEL